MGSAGRKRRFGFTLEREPESGSRGLPSGAPSAAASRVLALAGPLKRPGQPLDRRRRSTRVLGGRDLAQAELFRERAFPSHRRSTLVVERVPASRGSAAGSGGRRSISRPFTAWSNVRRARRGRIAGWPGRVGAGLGRREPPWLILTSLGMHRPVGGCRGGMASNTDQHGLDQPLDRSDVDVIVMTQWP